MVLRRPTPDELLERVRELEGGVTDEELARRLNVTLRSVSRWKAGAGMEYESALALLDRIGALQWPATPSEDGEEDDLEETLDRLVRLFDRLRRQLARQVRQEETRSRRQEP